MLRISLFGQPRVVDDYTSREFPLPRKTLNVLGYLILKSKRPPTRDAVAFALFPDEDEEKARGSLRRNLSYLLSSLPSINGGEPFVIADTERVAWNPAAPAHVDVLAFERAIAEGRDDDALAEYAGQLLPTLYDDWTTADRERLREAANDALARIIARDRSLRKFDAATASAHRLLEDDPWREDIVRQLMAIRYEAGDRAGALATFAQFEARMRHEMGAEPMAETLALQEAILRGARLATSEPATPKRSPEFTELEIAALPFVGREEPMRLAIERWHASADGRSGSLFITGEAGIGKSRFVAELARAVEREGGAAIIGETSAGGERRPYEAVIEALRYAAAARPGDTWRALIDNILDEQQHATLSDDRSARIRLFGAIQKTVTELARARPLAIVLEDLHWAGPATIELIGYLLDHLSMAPVLVVGTYRDDELPRAHPLRELVRNSRLLLKRLAEKDATDAARALAVSNLADEALAEAVAWSEGVPLLLSEAVRDLSSGRQFSGGNFLDILANRFDRLAPEAETALTFAAIIGARFELETLAASTGWRDEELVDALAPSMDLGLVRAGPRGRGLAFAFSHHVIHAAMLARVSESDGTRVHALVARALRTLFTGGDRALEIAQHYAAAGESRTAAEQYLAGARYALSVFANAEARESASAGLALCDDTDPSQRVLRYDLIDVREQSLSRIGATEERRIDAESLVSLAEGDDGKAVALGRLFAAFDTDAAGRKDALTRLAAVANNSALAERTYVSAVARHAYLEGEIERAREAALDAALAFERAGDVAAAMKARLLGISSLSRLGSFEQAQAEVEQLRPILQASDDLVQRWEFHLVAGFAYGDTDREAALREARYALELALRIGDRWGEARARQNAAASASKLRQYEEALDQMQRSLAAYRDVGDAPAITNQLLNIIALRVWCGDYDRSRALLDEVEEEATPYVAFMFQLVHGVLATRLERFEEAERCFLDVRRRAESLGAMPYRARAEFEFANVLALQGRLSEAAAYLQSAIDAYATMARPDVEVEAWALSAKLLAMMGDSHGARERAERVAARCEEKRLQSYSEIAWNLTSAYIAIGDETLAETFARCAAAAAVDDALRMPADLAETYMRLPWHQQAIAYLWGR